MKRVIVGLACLLASALLAPPASAQGDDADLAVWVAWAGTGTPHVQNGGTATWTVTVRNLGPATAQQVGVTSGGSDQFGQFVSSCGQGSNTCVLGDLAAGESRTITVSATACLVQTEHRRVWWVSSGADSTTPDPTSADNVASLDVRITGSFRTCPVS